MNKKAHLIERAQERDDEYARGRFPTDGANATKVRSGSSMSRMGLRNRSISSEDGGRGLTKFPKNWVIKTDICKIVKKITDRFVVKAEANVDCFGRDNGVFGASWNVEMVECAN